MPFLETSDALVARFSQHKDRSEEPPHVDPAQRPPTPMLPTHIHSTTICNNQTTSSTNTVPNTCRYYPPEPLQGPPANQPPPAHVGSKTTDKNQATTSSDTADPTISTARDLFTNAHNFTIGQVITISNIHSSATVTQQLMEKGMPSAMHDSSFRTYPPRCHPGTRETLRKHIVGWGEGDGCDGRMFWVLGPPAVGKSAIAQTVAEEFEERRSCLGASFFFSRSNQLDDPDRVIPTLAAQLATKHPQYKYILTQRLADNPLILEKNRRTQFRELIIEPFHTIMIHHPSQPPLLIILDGLDECKDKQAQCEFIELISTHVRQVNKFPLRWLICSRPEWYLKSMLSDVDFHVICKRQELEIENRQAEEDVRRLLVAGFDKIRKRYKDRLPIDWPPEVCLQRIASVASGHFGFASFLLRFIGNEQDNNPSGRLHACMSFLCGDGTTGVINPLRALDLLYYQILSDVPTNILLTTIRILGLLALYPSTCLSADDQARFLGLDQDTLCRSLQNLHSVLHVPSVDEFNTHGSAFAADHSLNLPTTRTDQFRVYHASFSDFLKDSSRSGKFWLNPKVVAYEIALQSLDWIDNDDGSPSNKNLIEFSVVNGWHACLSLSDDFIPGLISRLERFSFHRLQVKGLNRNTAFMDFLQWLHALGNTRNKFLISVIQDNPQEQAPMLKEIRVKHVPTKCSSHDFIASFIPDIGFPELPYTLKIRLGRASQVDITIIITDGPSHAIIYSLHDGFNAIRRKFTDHLPPNWPPESHLLQIAAAAYRDADIASLLLRFIGDEEYRNPHGQLEVCREILRGRDPTDTVNPFHYLDPLYYRILSDISVNVLPTTMRILRFLIFYFYHRLSANDQARFLHLDQGIFRRSLQNLHSVIYVPSVGESHRARPRVYHTSFSDFLKDPNRSGKFWLNPDAAMNDVALQSLHWMENDDRSQSNETLIEFSVLHGWHACWNLPNDFIPGLINRLEHFNFSHITQAHIIADDVAKLLKRLYSLGSTYNKSLISVIRGNNQAHSSVCAGIQIIHWPLNPRGYIAPFVSDVGAPEFPFTLNLRLGKVSQVAITIIVVDRGIRPIIRYLRKGFGEIRQGFVDHLPPNWPPESHLLQIAAATSGDVDIAPFLLRFISDRRYSNPSGQLDACMGFLDGGGILRGVNPSRTLDLFYRQILSGVPTDIFPTTMRILGLFVFYPHAVLSASDQVRFLNLDQATFCQSLLNLHSVVYVPPMDELHTARPRIYHTSFSDFLKDSSRSGKFWLNPDSVMNEVALQSLHWMENDDGSPSRKAILKFSAHNGWDACRQLSNDLIPDLINRLERVDFCRLKYAHITQGPGFVRFLQWLYSLGSIRNKSLISIRQETYQEQAPPNKMRVECHVRSPHNYIASFIPEVSTYELPFTLHLRLGKAVQVDISLEVKKLELSRLLTPDLASPRAAWYC